MWRVRASTKGVAILSLRDAEHLLRLLAKKMESSINFSHLFARPGYPIFYLEAQDRKAKQRSAIGSELGGQRRGSC